MSDVNIVNSSFGLFWAAFFSNFSFRFDAAQTIDIVHLWYFVFTIIIHSERSFFDPKMNEKYHRKRSQIQNTPQSLRLYFDDFEKILFLRRNELKIKPNKKPKSLSYALKVISEFRVTRNGKRNEMRWFLQETVKKSVKSSNRQLTMSECHFLQLLKLVSLSLRVVLVSLSFFFFTIVMIYRRNFKTDCM